MIEACNYVKENPVFNFAEFLPLTLSTLDIHLLQSYYGMYVQIYEPINNQCLKYFSIDWFLVYGYFFDVKNFIGLGSVKIRNFGVD